MRLVGELHPARPPPPTGSPRCCGPRRCSTRTAITAWQDAIVGGNPVIADAAAAYLPRRRDGMLTARVVGALWWDRDRGAEQIPELVERAERADRRTAAGRPA